MEEYLNSRWMDWKINMQKLECVAVYVIHLMKFLFELKCKHAEERLAHPWSLQYCKEEPRSPVHQLIAWEVDNKNMHIFKGLTVSNKGVRFILGWLW